MSIDYISYLLSLEPKRIKLGLERTEQLLYMCGDPQKTIQSIQVIGTNGKGSTSAMIANILKVSGYKVGLYTSPHLTKINERIRINGNAISDDQIIEFVDLYQASIKQTDSSFFEAMTALAVWHFSKEKVDIAILETGLGGRLDSITACDSSLLVCTSISKDHQHILGNSIEEIAYEKICALKKNMLCISSNHKDSIKNIFNKYAASINAKIEYVTSSNDQQCINLNGTHQFENEMLAIATIKQLTQFNISETDIKKGLASVVWPGRLQQLSTKPLILFDVAHNEKGFLSLCNFVKSLNCFNEKILIIALQKNKHLYSSINIINSLFDCIITTQTNIRNYVPAHDLATLFNSNKSSIISEPVEAIQYAKNSFSNQCIVIAGSHYLGPIISKEFKISFENI